jgi:hypothetical protein
MIGILIYNIEKRKREIIRKMKKIAVVFSTILLAGCSNGDIAEKTEKPVDTIQQQNDALERQMEGQYLTFLSKALDVYDTNIKDIQKLYGELLANPSVADEKDWNQKINQNYENIKGVYNKEMNLPYIPDKFKTLHETAKLAIGSTLVSQIVIFEGFKQTNKETVYEGGVMMQDAIKKIKEVRSEIEMVRL